MVKAHFEPSVRRSGNVGLSKKNCAGLYLFFSSFFGGGKCSENRVIENGGKLERRVVFACVRFVSHERLWSLFLPPALEGFCQS